MRTRLALIATTLALALGIAIAYVDSRATWDDAGVTAAALFITSLVFATLSPRAAWLIAFAAGAPVVAINIVQHGNYGSLMAIAVCLLGAGIGRLIGKTIGRGEAARRRVPHKSG